MTIIWCTIPPAGDYHCLIQFSDILYSMLNKLHWILCFNVNIITTTTPINARVYHIKPCCMYSYLQYVFNQIQIFVVRWLSGITITEQTQSPNFACVEFLQHLLNSFSLGALLNTPQNKIAITFYFNTYRTPLPSIVLLHCAY